MSKNNMVARGFCPSRIRRTGVVAGVALLLALPAVALAGETAPGNSHAFEKSLAQWMAVYFEWYYGAREIAPDANGNAAVRNVVLLAIPNTPGDGTPGSIDITLKPGQAFVLPLWSLLGQSYPDGSSDPAIELSVFQTLDITLQVDGKTVISNTNVMDYYSQFDLNPPIEFYEGAPFIWFQGIGLTHAPLSVGQHTITLDVVNPEPIYAFLTIEYHNTWNITVAAGK